MTTYNFLEQLNRNQSVNPDYISAATNTTAQSNPAATVIPMVSEDAIDTDMSDKIIKTDNVNETKPAEPEKEEKPGFFKRMWNGVKKTANNIADGAEQLYKRGVIKVAELTDSETVLEYAHGFEELSDKNLERLADTDVKSEIQKFRQKAGEVVARIKDAKQQYEVAMRHTKDGDDDVRIGYARNLPNMHAENQAPVAGNIAEHSVTKEPVGEVLKQTANCAVEQQAAVMNAATKGIVANSNYNDEIKTELGIEATRQIPNLDESQQAEAYTCTANNMHQYEKVVNEVTHHVANVASENVRQEAMAKLQKSEYENIKTAFTPENIKRVQTEYKRMLGVEEKEDIPDSSVKTGGTTKETGNQEITAQTNSKTQGAETAAATAQPAEKITEAAAQTTKETVFVTTNKTTTEESTGTSRGSLRYTTTPQSEAQKSTAKTFKECKTLADVEEVIKNAPNEDVKKFYARLNESQKLGLFKNTQSPDIQLSMLKHGIVKYEEVYSNLLPAVKSKLDVFTLNHEIEDAVKLI